MADVFEKRIRRAEQLEKEWAFAAEMLRFYRKIFDLQERIFQDLQNAPSADSFFPLRQVDSFLDLVQREGPAELASRARELPGRLRELLDKGDTLDDPVLRFFPRVLMQPAALSSSLRNPHAPDPGEASGHCPRCTSLPQVSILREDKRAETVRRSLLCSRCSHEWDFARVLCPGCQEERPEKLPRYTAQEIPWMRVEACDSCKKYLKSVDLTQNWEAEPVVDELASTPLDVIAREHGYEKIAPNLAGI